MSRNLKLQNRYPKKPTKNNSHPIPKEDRLPQHPLVQEMAVYLYLEETPLWDMNRALGLKNRNSKAVSSLVNRLFRGRYKKHGTYHPKEPLFDKLRDRTKNEWTMTERTCIGWAVGEGFAIQKISKLTGRYDLVALQKCIDTITEKDNTLY
jgi:hypothetical protein